MARRASFLLLAFFLTSGVSLTKEPTGLNSPLLKKAETESPLNSWAKVGHPTLVSPHANPIVLHRNHVFVVNTPSDTIDVIDVSTQKIKARIPVGVDPVSLAIRPDGKEVWVSNHVSDSVSVIDNDPQSPTYFQIIATVQEFHSRSNATLFDEPMGIAFANNEKAYVALSSENEIAVIDVKSKRVTKKLKINAQDPRVLKVLDNRLYVIPFESNNKTQLSGGTGKIDGDLVTFDARLHSLTVNNVLSLGHVLDIIKNPKVPDHDLYVFDTQTDKLVQVVDTLGTLLYGMTLDSKGNIFIAQTDARNDANGRSGTKKHGLKELENRAFLNQITKVMAQGKRLGKAQFFDLEPLPPKHPEKGQALATPFGIQISQDDSTLLVTAAGSDKLFTVNSQTGAILGRVSVGGVPRGIALQNLRGKPTHAWVFNAVENSVSVVEVKNLHEPKVTKTVALNDPTHPKVKRGRLAFNTASASSTGTFSCASCHPDGHTDQLLWVLKTPIVTGGKQIMPRSTMPIRGLRDTAPFHWDGIPGDPYGGINSASIRKKVEPNSKVDQPESQTRHLIDGGLASTMLQEGDKTVNDEGKSGLLTKAQREDMATFLLSVPYPPAQKRSFTNVLSDQAKKGFELFHIDGDHDRKSRPNVCGNCHRMPFWVSTNTPGTGMDAPTWRGAYDRFLILPQGRLNIIDFDFYARIAHEGIPERKMWRFSWGGRSRFNPVWDMVLEGSTGYSGTFARQVTLNESTAQHHPTTDLLDALEISAAEDAIVLEVNGVILQENSTKSVNLQGQGSSQKFKYVQHDQNAKSYSREALITLAQQGKFIGTFTARHGSASDVDHPQPAIWTLGPIEKQRGQQDFPVLYNNKFSMKVSGRYIDPKASIFVNGRKVKGTIRLEENEELTIRLASLPREGLQFLQLQNPGGMFSNDFIFHVTPDEEAARALKRRIDHANDDWRERLARAIRTGDLDQTKFLRRQGVPINEVQRGGNSNPINLATRHNRVEIMKYLMKHRVRVHGKSRDGTTALHTAATYGRLEMAKMLLKYGASPLEKNRKGETPIAVATSAWNSKVEERLKRYDEALNLNLDLKRIQENRTKIAKLLRDHLKKMKSVKEF